MKKKISIEKAQIKPIKLKIQSKKPIKNEKIKNILKLLEIDDEPEEKESKDQRPKNENIISKKKKELLFKKKKSDKKEINNMKTEDETEDNETSESNSILENSYEEMIANLSLDQNKKKKKEPLDNKNKIESQDQKENTNNKINQKDKSLLNFIIKNIEKDGNCFYRCLSYHFRGTEEEHPEFRELITNYIINNPEEYLDFISFQDINLTGNENENIIFEKKRNFIINYAKEASEQGEWAGDIEIGTAATLFNCNINMFSLNENGLTIYNKYNLGEDIERVNKETINILYINSNHYNLLIPKEENLNNNNVILKNINLKEMENIILDDKKKSNRKLNKNLKLNINKKKYVDYPRSGLKNYYNEIYNFLKDNSILPERLQYSKEKNRKTMEKKRGKFRKMVNQKYRIENNRLQYLYYYKNKQIWVNIIYQEEKIPILNYLRYNNNHIKRETMDQRVIEMGYYWHGYSTDIENLIKSCGICHTENKAIKIPNNPKIIITYGPNKRYQCDLWYIPDNLKESTNFLYCLDIIDHFSKWLCSYLLKNKTAELVVSKIKSFFRDNKPCEIFQTDNGKEFNNILLKTFLEDNHIKYLRSAPYHPQTNGCCEAVHKEIKTFLLRKKELLKDSFDIEIALEEAIDFHNNRILKSTGYKPVDLRNVEDKNIIDEVNKNIIKSMNRKVTKKLKIPKNTLLLLTPDIEIRNNIYILKKHKSKKAFVIPALFVKYLNSNNITVKVMVNYNNDIILKKGDIIKISNECCRIIDDFGFNFYLKQNGEDINWETLNKLALFVD